MSYTEGNQTILTAIPSLSPAVDFINLSRSQRGYYIIGHDKFPVTEISLTSPFQRAVGGPAEDFFLGILSVIFISVLSEIVQTVFLRTRYRSARSKGIYTAYLIDEYSHFRNIWTHATANNIRAQRVRQKTGHPAFHHSRSMFLSVFVLFVAAMIFAADVVAVYITQPRRYFSNDLQYNIRGVQPIAITPGLSKYIRTLVDSRPCISPFFQLEDQARHFVINTCTAITSEPELDQPTDLSREISIRSFYHLGGSDHTVKFGELGQHKLRIRAEIFLDEGGRAVKRVLFNETENLVPIVRYLHEVTIHAIMEWSCNQPFADSNCEQIAQDLVMVSSKPIIEDFLLWKVRDKEIKRNFSGLETVFRVAVNNPFEASRQGLRVLATSSALQEVRGQGWYEDQLRRNHSLGIPNLVSEDGRVAGVYLLGLIVLFISILLATLRFLLEPVSLASVAFQYLERQTQRMRDGEDDGKIPLSYEEDEGWSDDDDDDSLDSYGRRTGARGGVDVADLPEVAIWGDKSFLPFEEGRDGLDSEDVVDSSKSASARKEKLDYGVSSTGSHRTFSTFDLEYEDVDYLGD